MLKDACRDVSPRMVPFHHTLLNKNEKFDTQRESQHVVMAISIKEEVSFLPLSLRPVTSHLLNWNSWLIEGIGSWGQVHCLGVTLHVLSGIPEC